MSYVMFCHNPTVKTQIFSIADTTYVHLAKNSTNCGSLAATAFFMVSSYFGDGMVTIACR